MRVPDSILNVYLPSGCVTNADECRPLTPAEKRDMVLNGPDPTTHPSRYYRFEGN